MASRSGPLRSSEWDGSDFFTVNGYPGYILVTERVKDLIQAKGLTNCVLIPSHESRWGRHPRPEDSVEEKRAMASRDLAELVAELETSDVSRWMKAADALGEKRDPGAVDFLLKGFSHPDPIVRQSAAMAVARIAGHIQSSEQVRNQTFAKLRSLLSHTNPLVRETAATALGLMGDPRAGDEVMKLLQDPEEAVRQTAVFVLRLIRHKPAREMVKRLTRDPSRSVRETARSALRDLL